MNPVIKRISLGAMGFVTALGAALAASDGGATMTISQIGDIPLLSWLLAIGAGISGALGIQPQKGVK